jgi:rare lipoprotein A
MKTLLLLVLLGSLAVVRAGEPRKSQAGTASWYGYECAMTASGERYDPMSLTAAHRTLPFGTIVEIRNLTTGRSVTVRINNRGPFSKGRVIDVSKRAAQELGMIKSGIAKVDLAVVP